MFTFEYVKIMPYYLDVLHTSTRSDMQKMFCLAAFFSCLQPCCNCLKICFCFSLLVTNLKARQKSIKKEIGKLNLQLYIAGFVLEEFSGDALWFLKPSVFKEATCLACLHPKLNPLWFKRFFMSLCHVKMDWPRMIQSIFNLSEYDFCILHQNIRTLSM